MIHRQRPVARICILTAGHFCTSPRVWREADVLTGAGFDVVVVGVVRNRGQAKLDEQMLRVRRWRYRAAADLRGVTLSSRLLGTCGQVRSRVARLATTLGVDSPELLGVCAGRMLSAVRQERPDLLIAHLQTPLWVADRLQREGVRIGADFEDWYSENPYTAPGFRYQRRLCRQLEQRVMHSAAHLTTTSRALSDALFEEYGGNRPEVIYNSNPAFTPRPGNGAGPLRLIWFSQTLGPDRGLQDIFGALPALQGDWELELRANADQPIRAWVKSQIPNALHSHVHILPTVAPDELPQLVAEHDIGLALDQPFCRNKELTISNKIIQYLQSGLLVACTHTRGHKEIMDLFKEAGECYLPGDTDSLAAILNNWIQNRRATTAPRARIGNLANELLSYETQGARLIQSVERALQR